MAAYVVSRVRIRDTASMQRYVTEAPATALAFGGMYLAEATILLVPGESEARLSRL